MNRVAAWVLGCSVALTVTRPAAAVGGGAAKRLFVMPVKATGLSEVVVASVQDALLTAMSAFPNYKTISRDEVEALARNQADRIALGCSDQSSACLAELGQAGNADALLTAGLGKIGESLVLSLTLIDPKSSQVLGRSTFSADSVARLVEGLKTPLREAFGIGGGKAAVRVASAIPRGAKAAVMPLGASNIEPEVASSLTPVVAQALKSMQGVSVVSQDEIAAMLQFESQKQSLGCDDAGCFAEIGGALGVDYLVLGTVGRIEDTYMVNLKLINIKAAEVQNRVNESFRGRPADLIRAARHAVAVLAGAEVKQPGKLSLDITPDDAAVELNGKKLDGEGRFQLDGLPAGRHAMQVNADGYYGAFLETYVEPNGVNNVLVSLELVPRPWYKSWAVWTAAALVLAGAAAGSYYAVEASRPPETGSVGLSFGREGGQ